MKRIEIFRRPFNVRAVIDGHKNIPFFEKPLKLYYMWRDIERKSRMYGIEQKILSLYPLVELTLADQIAISGKEEGWIDAYNEVT